MCFPFNLFNAKHAAANRTAFLGRTPSQPHRNVGRVAAGWLFLLEQCGAILAALWAFGWLPAPVHAAAARRPNIVLIVADDLGFSDIGCFGGEIRTPNLDRLANQGTRFTQFYNNAVCNTTRASIMTGLYPRLGTGQLLRNDMVTLAEVLRDTGYATAMSGKWHLGGAPTRPIDRGFDEYYGIMIGAVNHFDPSLPDPPPYKHAGPPDPFVHNATPIRSVSADYYTTDAFTDHAVAQIRTLAKGGKPFFLHLAYAAPHYPLQARPEDIARYRGRYREGYTVLREQRYRRLVELNLISRDWKLPATDRIVGQWRYDLEPIPWETADQAWEAAKMEIYAGMVDRLDQGVGRVMRALEESGADDNTLVLFFSDNGGCGSHSSTAAHDAFKRGDAPGGKDSYILCGPGWATAQSSPFRRYKTWTYEGGITTPMIARWKGHIAPNRISHSVSHLVDLMPTFVELAGGRYPAHRNGRAIIPVEGTSLAPLFAGQEGASDRELGWYLYGSRGYRSGKWKIVWGVTAKKWELYDMEADRTETKDLARDHPEILRRLVAAWEAWARRTEVPL